LPKISIITICFNSEKTIEKTFNSIRCQNYKDYELIVIDGASNDNTLEIIKKNSDLITKYISEPDDGIYNAMNKGIKIATGDIIGFLNSDDEYYNNNALSEISKAFKEDVDCVYGNLVFERHDGKIVRKWTSKRFKPGKFRYSWSPAHPTFYCKKSAYDRLGYYREDFSIAADVDLMFRFLEIHRIKSFFINKNLIKMKLGGVSTNSFRSTIVITKEVFTSFRENNYNYSYIVYLVGKILKALKQLI